jgi:hypothetical protein
VSTDIWYEERVWRPAGTDDAAWEAQKTRVTQCEQCIAGYPWVAEEESWRIVVLHRHQGSLTITVRG